MLTYVAESAASAPPPRGLPFAPPAARASGAGGYVPPALLAGANDTLDEDAQPAFAAPGGAEAPEEGGFPVTGSGDEDDGPPLEALEAQMSGEVAARDATAGGARRPARPANGDDDEAGGSSTVLPDLDGLTARLPADVRETLDELFRARFVSVKRLPKRVFKPASAKAPPAAT